MSSLNKPYRVGQWQVLARDPKRAADFYKACFGWTTRDRNSLGYRSILDGGLAGGIWPLPQGTPFVQLFVNVPDVDAAVAHAVQSGGRVALEKQVLPDGDEMAIILDPEGITWGVMLDRQGDSR
jgi:predicted enzyme related to lactoylglutathione lyase